MVPCIKTSSEEMQLSCVFPTPSSLITTDHMYEHKIKCAGFKKLDFLPQYGVSWLSTSDTQQSNHPEKNGIFNDHRKVDDNFFWPNHYIFAILASFSKLVPPMLHGHDSSCYCCSNHPEKSRETIKNAQKVNHYSVLPHPASTPPYILADWVPTKQLQYTNIIQ